MGGEPTRVEVRIYGDTYVVRAAGVSADHVRNLAAAVDVRMRELTRRQPALTVTRAAVLTALNLADELWRLREQHKQLLAAVSQRLAALESPAGTVAAIDLDPASTRDPEGAAGQGEPPT